MPCHYFNTDSILSAKPMSCFLVRCIYIASVIRDVECPNLLATSITLAPACKSKEACVCLKIYNLVLDNR